MMMILARQLFHYNTDVSISSYKTWVETTIGGMLYSLKSQTAFTKTIESLQAIVFFETDLDILHIHAQTVIKPPRGQYNLVLEYKQILRAHMASLGPVVLMDLT